MYIGWDIGIKNLAYCNLEVLNDNNDASHNSTYITLDGTTFNIKDWGVLNLVDDLATNKISDGEIILTSRPKVNCFAPKIAKGMLQKDKNSKEVKDIWVFERNMDSQSLMWKLIEVSSK